MPFQLEDMDLPLAERMQGNGKPMLKSRDGARGGMAGVSPANMPQRSKHPCYQMQWLEDNFPQYDFVSFVEVGAETAEQGLRILARGSGTVVKEWRFTVHGGEDGDIYRQIPRNHKKMMARIMEDVWEAYEAGDLEGLGGGGGNPGGGPGGGGPPA